MGVVINLAKKRQSKQQQQRVAERAFDAEQDADRELNQLFDRLEHLVKDAWQFRDPESMRELHDQVMLCIAQVEVEWQEPVLTASS